MRITTVTLAIAALFASASVTANTVPDKTVPDKTVVDLAKCTEIERYGPFGNHCGGCRQDWHFVAVNSYVACNRRPTETHIS
ncbi:hypothetical protein VE03_03672 [Pseudogymnoascus sp. 23342-1-I1]|nr:hypothetical protein VE03_03581 [Pseudogymnoascus sp. 23342-1-I1]OBT66579.1 hypothetical protein VE03_03672 [Pseudogymnoascus sp. 23342-1-I1]